MQKTLTILVLSLLSGIAAAESSTVPWALTVSLGHQSCKAEGGALCSENTNGMATELGLSYHLNRILSLGLDTSFGQFSGDDGYTTVTSLVSTQARYEFQGWGLLAEIGYGYMSASREENEPSVGKVEYRYTTFQALRFGGGLFYALPNRFTIIARSNLTLGGKSELCATANETESCRENQDLIDLWSTSLGLSYGF